MTAQQEVEHRIPPPVVHDEGVERQLDEPVQEDPSRGLVRPDETGAEGVEEDLEGTEGARERGARRGGE